MWSAPSSDCNRENESVAFSLLELLVAMAVLSLIVVLFSSMIGATQKVWSHTTGRTEQFQKARQALQTISARLSESTLHPYWLVETNSVGSPIKYVRQSDLRFLAGPAASITSLAAPGSGSALFFQSPTGFASQNAERLEDALNTWGYFVEYGSDTEYRPPFLASAGIPVRNRFRLVEVTDPSDKLELFKRTSGNSTYSGLEWFSAPLADRANRRVLADNIIALIVLPRLSSANDSTGIALAPGYRYDSTGTNSNKQLNPRHQLPPIVDIVLVAIDDRSARRIDWTATPPDLGTALLFQNPAVMEADLETLRSNLSLKGLSAGVFRASIPIPAARWSTEQSN